MGSGHTDRFDEDLDVFDLALNGISCGVAAIAPVPRIVVNHCEIARQ